MNGEHGRLIAVSAYGAGDSHHRNLYNRLLWMSRGSKMHDKEEMEQEMRSRPVDWTIVRPSFLTKGRTKGAWRASPDLRMRVNSHISRGDLASFIVDEISKQQWSRQAVSVTG